MTYNFFWIIFFYYSSSLCCKTFEKKLRQKKSYRKKKYSQPLLVDTKLSPRDHAPEEFICNQCLFMSCAGVIKQTINYSFWNIKYTCFAISSIMSELCLLFRPNLAWTDGTNLSLIDELAMIKWVTRLEKAISPKRAWWPMFFYCTFQVIIMWRTIEKSLKKILRQRLLLKNHLNDILHANYADVDDGEILWVCIYGVHSATVTRNVCKLYVLCGWKKWL